MSTTVQQTVPPDSLVFCLFCMEDTARVRISKARMPYLDCPECRTRVFWNSDRAVRGYFRWCPDAIRVVAQATNADVDDIDTLRARYDELEQTYGEFAKRSLVNKRARQTARHDERDDS